MQKLKMVEYKRIIRYMFVLILLLFESTAFVFVWSKFYWSITLYQYNFRGSALLCVLYSFTLVILTYNMGGSKFGLLKRNNISYSQGVAAVVVNIIFYFVLVLLSARFVNVIPIVIITIIDILFISFWGRVSYWILSSLFQPRHLLVLYQDYEPDKFVKKLNTRNDKYLIEKVVNVDENQDELWNLIDKSEGVVLYDIHSEFRNEIIKYCYNNSIRMYLTLKVSDVLMRSAEELNLFDTQVVLVREYDLNFEQRMIKKMMDLFISICLIIITSPIMLLTAIAIKICDGGPILFTQERCTKNGKIFRIHKFRSMIVEAEKDGMVHPTINNDNRITPVGKIIRASRVDELPQLFDILVGDMSFVGPRPERVEHVQKYSKEIPEFSFRLKVKAGLTGYAQIYGKYNTNPYDKLKLDLTYIANYSILMDIKLILLTIKVIFMKESTEGFEEQNMDIKVKDR